MPKIVSLDPALVAAAGLTPNATSNIEDIERALQEAPALRQRLGITTLAKLKPIGQGSWARVYRLGDGRVLKLTTDASDAHAAALVAAAPSRPAGLAPVHEVVKFPWPVRDRKWDPIRGIGGDVKRDLYGIVMTYVPKPKEDSAEEALLEQIFRAFDNLLVDAGFNGTDPLWELRRRDDDDLTPWLWDLTHGWMWLAERGWQVRDVNTHNIGILDGEVVLLDMGLSSTERAKMPEIEMAANPEATGDCYRQALLEARKRDGAKLVHGHVEGISPVKHHAWVEADGLIIDPAARIETTKKHLAQLGVRYVAEATYDPWKATALSVKHGHWGPWHGDPVRNLVANGKTMAPVVKIFDECFVTLREQFPDFGDIELHEDEAAGGDNGHGSERQFGYCKDGDPIVIAFAPKTGALATSFIRGLMRHEFGHAIDFRYGKSFLERTLDVELPHGVERRADAIAEVVFGDPIVYGGQHLVQCVSCQGQYPRPKKLGA